MGSQKQDVSGEVMSNARILACPNKAGNFRFQFPMTAVRRWAATQLQTNWKLENDDWKLFN
jgi:hypothetical protein